MAIVLKHKDSQALKQVKSDLLAWRAAADVAKTAKSAEGKAHTKAKNAMTAFLAAENLPVSSEISVADGSFTYGVATTSRIDARRWHQMYTNKEITEEQYFDALTVGKDDAKDAIGADQVEEISVNVSGKDAKVRFTKRAGDPDPEPDRTEIVKAQPKPNAPKRPSVLASPVKAEPLQTAAKPGLRKLTLKRP